MYTVRCSDLAQYYYCPRKIYFLKTMDVPVQPKPKMKLGKEEEEKERKRFLERKKVFGFDREKIENVEFKTYLESEEIGLCGIVDTLVTLEDGEKVPIDVKYTDSASVKKHWKKQITSYSLLIEGEYEVEEVSRGVIYFPEQNEPISVDITQEDKEFLLKDIERIRDLIESERVPRKVSEKKCSYCEVKRYCV